MKLKCLLMFICLSIGTVSFGQSSIRVGYKLGYEYQQSSFGEAGILAYKTIPFFGNSVGGFYSVYLGAESRVGGSKYLIGPKMAFEMHAFVLGGRLSAGYLSDFKQRSWQITPEFGLSLIGYVYVFAGYNWTVSNREFWNATGPKISMGINLYALEQLRN